MSGKPVWVRGYEKLPSESGTSIEVQDCLRELIQAGDSLRGSCDMEGFDEIVARWDAALAKYQAAADVFVGDGETGAVVRVDKDDVKDFGPLIEKWRKKAGSSFDSKHIGPMGKAGALRDCADELEALLGSESLKRSGQ